MANAIPESLYPEAATVKLTRPSGSGDLAQDLEGSQQLRNCRNPAFIVNPHRHHTPTLLLLATVCVLACTIQVHAADDTYIVRTTAGLAHGAVRPGGGAEFLGIPYAEPPVGKLRWRAPVPKKPWKGIRDATSFGWSCPQPLLGGAWNRHDAENNREDCLYINVFTPAWPAAKPLPVIFWIHGGANIGGSGFGSFYTEGTLPEHGVVLVTFNYRLGVLGFFAHPELTRESPHHASGNYGLMDQILALQWVHSNIARFGGDPNNITVAGQSAGSMDIGMLMTSPLAAGLFQMAIAESGAAFSPPVVPLADEERFSEEAAADLHAPAGRHAIAFLRKIPAADLLAKLGDRAFEWPGGFTPDVDGWVLPTSPQQVFAGGKEAAIPLLIGATSREFGDSEPLDALRESIQSAAGDLAPQALALYGLAGDQPPASDPLYGSASVQWNADKMFHCPIATQALWHSEAHQPTYEYEFDRPIPGQEAQGALHSAELPYVFGNFPKSGNLAGNFAQIDTRLADLIETYWTNFAIAGDPNYRSGDSPNLPAWPRLDDSQRYLIFTPDGGIALSNGPLRAPQCDLYRKMLTQSIKQEQ